MNDFYRIDSTRVSYREYWWHTKSPLVLFAWLIRLLRVPVPSSTDDANVEALEPFEVQEADLPEEVKKAFDPLSEELRYLGFRPAIYHAIPLLFNYTRIYWATFYHQTGRAIARIHNRIWTQPKKPRNRLFPVFITAFRDGGYLSFSAGKPDMLAPPGVDVHYRPGASVSDLWQAHEMALEVERHRPIILTTNAEQVRAVVHADHAGRRDFHVARGVFVPFIDTNPVPLVTATAEPLTVSAVEEPEVMTAMEAPLTVTAVEEPAMPVENAEVLDEVVRLQNRKSSWIGGLLTLGISAAIFVGAGMADWSWKFLAMVIPILLIHELGHLAMMRLFHYRNTRMFFIPFFGAAVTGQNFNVPGWKKAVVSLMGPVPGIFLGAVLGVVGLISHRNWLVEASLFALILNAFNLLPILPLDGGWVCHATLFCRHRYLDVAFRALAIMGLVGIALLTHDRILTYVAIGMLIGLPMAYRTAAVVEELRRRGPVPPSPDGQHIPRSFANEIVTGLKKKFSKSLSARNTARLTLNVYEAVNARPPGVLATLGLLGVQGGSFILACILGLVFLVGQRNDLLKMARMAAERPKTPYTHGSLMSRVPQVPAAGERSTIVAELSDRAAGESAFSELSGRLPPAASLTLFGQTLLLNLPAQADKERNQYFDQLLKKTKLIAVDNAKHHVGCRLFCMLPASKQLSADVADELSNYFAVSALGPVIPPWSPLWKAAPQVESWRKARRTYHRLITDGADYFQSPEAKAVNQKLREATARGNETEKQRALEEQRRSILAAKEKFFASLRAEGPSHVDLVVIDSYAEFWKASQTSQHRPSDEDDDETQTAKMPPAMIARMGVRPSLDGSKGASPPDVSWGYATREGPYLSIWLSSARIDDDVPALAEWLYANGCDRLTYQFVLGNPVEDLLNQDPD
jgi:Zn-dependent protease